MYEEKGIEITKGELIAFIVIAIGIIMIFSPLIYNLGFENGRANIIDARHWDDIAYEYNLDRCYSDQNGLLNDVLILSQQLDSCKNLLTGGEYFKQLGVMK